jgi:hypothetical protein
MLNLKVGKKPVAVSFAVKKVPTFVIQPPLLSYWKRYLGMGYSGPGGGSLSHMLRWYAMMPVFL